MLTQSQLVLMLEQPEGPLIERKPSRVNAREIRQTVVAFANAVSGDEEAVLFIGVGDRGDIHGCTAAEVDAHQKTVREVCEKQCYPPIGFRISVLSERRNVVAVIVPPSANRPHFAGPAYVRRGSENVAASPEVFDELVYSRNSKVAAFFTMKRSSQVVRVVGTEYGRGEGRHLLVGSARGIDCKVFECSAHYVRFEVIANTLKITEPLENVAISYDDEKQGPKIVVAQR